jgi:hypothetical protein
MTSERALSAAERDFALRVADKLRPAAKQVLLDDLSQAVAVDLAGDSSRVCFRIPDYPRPKYSGQHAYPVEGRLRDADGSLLTAVLYADENDRLLELELIRYEEGPVIRPDWSSLEVG